MVALQRTELPLALSQVRLLGRVTQMTEPGGTISIRSQLLSTEEGQAVDTWNPTESSQAATRMGVTPI